MRRSKRSEPRLELVPVDKIDMPGVRVAIAKVFLGLERNPSVLKSLLVTNGHLALHTRDNSPSEIVPQSWMLWGYHADFNGVPFELASESLRRMGERIPELLFRVDPIVPSHQGDLVGITWTPLEALRAACKSVRQEIEPDLLTGTPRFDAKVIRDAALVLMEVIPAGDEDVRLAVDVILRYGSQLIRGGDRVTKSDLGEAIVRIESRVPENRVFKVVDFDTWDMPLDEYERLIERCRPFGLK